MLTVLGLSWGRSCILKLPRVVSILAVYFLEVLICMAGAVVHDLTLAAGLAEEAAALEAGALEMGALDVAALDAVVLETALLEVCVTAVVV